MFVRHIPVKSLHLLKNLMTTLWTDKKWSIYHTVLCAIQVSSNFSSHYFVFIVCSLEQTGS